MRWKTTRFAWIAGMCIGCATASEGGGASDSAGTAGDAAEVGAAEADAPEVDSAGPDALIADSLAADVPHEVSERVDAGPPDGCRVFGVPTATRQIVVVRSTAWNADVAEATRWAREPGADWFCGIDDERPVVLGKSGLGWGIGLHEPSIGAGPVKAEGDGRSPAGAFRLGTAFGLEADFAPARGWPYLLLTAQTHCVDDSRSEFYNQIVEAPKGEPIPWASSEKMASYTTAYRLGVLVHHNDAPAGAVPGGGSCIFLHVGKVSPPSPTVGCTALPYAGLAEWVNWLEPDAEPLLVQLPASEPLP